jgi:outer membrane protein TolC
MNRMGWTCSWVVLSLLLPGQTYAQTGTSSHDSPLELSEVLTHVWQKSPQLDAQETQANLASGDRWRRFIFNEPQFQYSNSDDDTANSYGLSLTTSFPFKFLALSRLDAAKNRAQKAELLAKKYELTKVVTQSYLDCAAANEAYKLQKITSSDLETVFQRLKANYEAGNSTQAEKIGAELQWRQARLDQITAEDKLEVLCRKFSVLIPSIGDGTSAPEWSKISLPDDLDASLIARLGQLTSDQSRAEAAIDTAEANSSIAIWSQLPDFTFTAARNHYVYLPGSPSGKEWTTTYGVSVTLPLFFPFREAVEVRRAKSQAAIDLNTAEIQKVSADSDQMDGTREYRRNKERLRELRTKDLPLGEALVESTYSAYRAGKLGYAELVLSRKTLTDLRNQDIQLRVSIINSHLKCLTRCEDPITSPVSLEKAVP